MGASVTSSGDGVNDGTSDTALVNAVRKPLDASRALAEVAMAKVRTLRHRRRYGAVAPKPYELLRVDPARIEYCTLPSLMAQLELSRYGSHVVGGDWDRRETHDDVWYTRAFDPPVVASFENHALYRSMRSHFGNGVPWDQTEWYRWIADDDGSVGQYPNVETMERRLTRVDELYERIRSEGYKTQRELASDENVPLSVKSFPYPEHHEVDVNIGRDGELFFNFNGRHRLAVAKLLDLDRIPVRVFARHETWQERRTNGGTGSVDPHIRRSHPDLSATGR